MTDTLARDLSLKQDYAFVDVETTGFDPLNDRIIEIGILRIRGGEMVKSYKTFINPERPLHPRTLEITGITEEMVADAPRFRDVAPDLNKLLHNSIFFAHNAQFDYGFFAHEFARTQQMFGLPRICTVKLSQSLYPGFRTHNLDIIAKRHKLRVQNRHRALDDAKLTWKFFEASKQELGESRVWQAMGDILEPPKSVVSRAQYPTSQRPLFG